MGSPAFNPSGDYSAVTFDPKAAYDAAPAPDNRSLLQKAKDGLSAIQASFDANTKTSASEPLLETGLKSLVGTIGAPFVHPLATAQSMAPRPITTGNSTSQNVEAGAEGLLGPSAVAARQFFEAGKGAISDYKEGGAGYAATKAAGQIAGTAMLGDAAGAVGDAVKGTKVTPVAGQNYAPTHAAAFEGAIAPATAMGKNFIPQNVTPEALTPIRNTAARMAQGSATEQGVVKAATSSDTPPLERVGAYQNIVQNALNDLEQQHAPALAQAANVPVDTSAIVQRLKAQISPTTDAADAAAIQRLATRVEQAKTIGDLNTFRQELNTETAPEYRQSQVQAGRSGITSQTTSDLAGWVRNAYFDELQQATGQDFAPLKRQEANLITVKEALENQQAPLAKAEATYAAPSTIREKAGNVANIVKDPKTTVTQTILRESPATKVSTLLQKSLADLPPAPTSTGVPAPPSPVAAPAQLPAQAGGAYPMSGHVPYSPGMTAGERSAALNQWLRQRRQAGLPAQATPIQLPPPGGTQ